jgi:hypothetical protein
MNALRSSNRVIGFCDEYIDSLPVVVRRRTCRYARQERPRHAQAAGRLPLLKLSGS